MVHITIGVCKFHLMSFVLNETETTGLVEEIPFSIYLAAASSAALGNDRISWTTIFLQTKKQNKTLFPPPRGTSEMYWVIEHLQFRKL